MDIVKKNSKKIAMVIVIILVFLFGSYVFLKLSKENVEFLIKDVSSINFVNKNSLFIHVLLLSISFLFCFLGIGIISLLIYLIIECVSIGFTFALYSSSFGLSGCLYSIVYLIVYKLVILALLVILILKYYKLSLNYIKFIRKENINLTKSFINIFYIISFIIFYEIILFFFGNNILNIFNFLLK